jgi:heptosyltransferase-3
MITPPRSILIANIRLIGDVLLSTPLLAILKRSYPDAQIDFLVNRGAGEFLERDPRVRQVIYSEKWNRKSKGLGNTYLTRVFRRYDLAISMNAGDRGAIAVLLAGKLHRVGYFESSRPMAAAFRKMLYSHPLEFQDEMHVVDRCRQISEALEINADRLEVNIFWDDSDCQKVAGVLSTLGSGTPYFVVHPFARWRYKYWDIERFAVVSDKISEKFGLRPVWTSSPDKEETSLLLEGAKKCKIQPILVPGELTLNQMACLISGAKLYLGLDTAITHIAASCGVPVVSVYGPTELWRWHPWNNHQSMHTPVPYGFRGTLRHGRIVTLQAGCSHLPCIRPNCYTDTENPCMMAVSAEMVFQKAERLLAAEVTEVTS